jgi:hypothetical protein
MHNAGYEFPRTPSRDCLKKARGRLKYRCWRSTNSERRPLVFSCSLVEHFFGAREDFSDSLSTLD